jgi:hypothetical protein
MTANFVLKLSKSDQKMCPPCFNSKKQFDAWRELARMSRPHSGICTDCTPEYKFEMQKQGRCEYPEVIFKVSGDGDLEGYLPAQIKKELRNAEI